MNRGRVWLAVMALWAFWGLVSAGALADDRSLPAVIRDVQSKIVKIYGAGGFRALEPYQSGVLISADGYVLTAHSYVLDADYITCTLDDGRKFEAKLLGADPRLEVAVLKIEATDLPYFDLAKAVVAAEGTRTLAFSNLFGIAFGEEPASVQRGVVAAVTALEARRGVFESLYTGRVYVVDAMTNNPGAAGGALTNIQGELLGMLGKELRNARNNTWLNYAIPISQLTSSVELIRAGKVPPAPEDGPDKKLPNPMTLEALGIVMMPNILPRTPPFVEKVRPNSPAAKAGVMPDDIILFIDDALVQSVDSLGAALARIAIDERIRLTVERDRALVEVTLEVPLEEQTPKRKTPEGQGTQTNADGNR
ncbi:MAG: S1C family serine protease [Pirellulales bacterium]